MKLINKLKEYLYRIKDYPRVVNELRLVEEEIRIIMTSGKVIVINPTLKLPSLKSLRRPLYLKGDNLAMNNLKMKVYQTNRRKKGEPVLALIGGSLTLSGTLGVGELQTGSRN